MEGAELMVEAHGVMEIREGGFGTTWQIIGVIGVNS